MTALSAPAILGRHRDLLEGALQGAVGNGATPLEAAARYVMGWEDEAGRPAVTGGKRIRPALCLFATEAFGGGAEEGLPGAVAVELTHNFSLVHDEIQDHDMERHHRPTTFARIGEAQAINVGDFLSARATRALLDGAGDPLRRMAALAVLNRAIERMIGGQWSDISFETREQVSVEEYLAMVAGKTGALLSAPLQMGAILAGASPEVADAIGLWGAHVGAAFQAQDDYLGTWGNPDLTGKSNTNDIARKKKTLPVVHGANHPIAGPILRRVYGKPEVTAEDVREVVRALEAAGSDRYCRERASARAEEADRMLEKLPIDEAARDDFRAIARYLVDRDA